MYACKSISKAKLVSEEDVADVKREVGAPGRLAMRGTGVGVACGVLMGAVTRVAVALWSRRALHRCCPCSRSEPTPPCLHPAPLIERRYAARNC